MSKKDTELLSSVRRGRQRKYVLKHVKDKPLLVSEITKLVNKEIKSEREGKEIRLRDVSRSLKWLEEQKLVKCLNPPRGPGDSGILYEITGKGQKIHEKLYEYNDNN